MSKKLIILMIALSLTLVITFSALACEPPPPPLDCSPGFWKNHTQYYDEGSHFYPDEHELSLIDALTQKGWGDQVSKWEAVDWLNTNITLPDGVSCD